MSRRLDDSSSCPFGFLDTASANRRFRIETFGSGSVVWSVTWKRLVKWNCNEKEEQIEIMLLGAEFASHIERCYSTIMSKK